MKNAQIVLPRLVRINPGALERLGVYLARLGLTPVALLHSDGLVESILDVALRSLRDHGIGTAVLEEVRQGSAEEAVRLLGAMPASCKALVGVGGGKALDVAKYTAWSAGLPYFAAPTSLSNDGFCSPQASLTLEGRRRSLPTGLPDAVVVDLTVCEQAPVELWHSGIGDLCSKFTAVSDWKLAFHRRGEPVNDLAALISDASVFQLMASPAYDKQGVRLLAMEIAGSSRPASGSEHLISHALDMTGARPRLHGLQTGTAAYLVSTLQRGGHHQRIGELLGTTGFWESVRKTPFSVEEWRI